MSLSVEHIKDKSLTPAEHAAELKQRVYANFREQDIGLYQRVELELDDLWKLLNNVRELSDDITFFQNRKALHNDIVRELAALQNEDVKAILMKPRLVGKKEEHNEEI